MPIFKKKTGKRDVAVRQKGDSQPAVASGSMRDLSGILIRPRITEKATDSHGVGVYVFDVDSSANAYAVADAVRAQFKVLPRKVNIVAIPSKAVIVRGRRGVKSGGKKAYVYLKKGDVIDVS
jgi:large subunit ribosomal protein L23